MKTQEVKKLRELTIAELLGKLSDLKKAFSTAQMQRQVGKLKNVRSLSNLRDDQAVVWTIINEKKESVS